MEKSNWDITPITSSDLNNLLSQGGMWEDISNAEYAERIVTSPTGESIMPTESSKLTTATSVEELVEGIQTDTSVTPVDLQLPTKQSNVMNICQTLRVPRKEGARRKDRDCCRYQCR